jgi:hypothetical protein
MAFGDNKLFRGRGLFGKTGGFLSGEGALSRIGKRPGYESWEDPRMMEKIQRQNEMQYAGFSSMEERAKARTDMYNLGYYTHQGQKYYANKDTGIDWQHDTQKLARDYEPAGGLLGFFNKFRKSF